MIWDPGSNWYLVWLLLPTSASTYYVYYYNYSCDYTAVVDYAYCLSTLLQRDLKKIINSRLLQNKVYLKQPRRKKTMYYTITYTSDGPVWKKSNSVFRLFWEIFIEYYELNANLESRFFYFSPNILGRFFKLNCTKSAEKLWKIGKKNGPKLEEKGQL